MTRGARLIAILGPTASGKTALAVELAKRLRKEIAEAEILSGDSMQVYRGLDIGTAKPSLEERGGIVHHLIDFLEPVEAFSAVDFVKAAEKVVDGIRDRGHIPILAGGTGLYVKALLEGYDFCGTGGDPAYRKELEELAKAQGQHLLHERLAERDPETAAQIHPNNVRRVIRALEALERGGERISRKQGFQETGKLCCDAWVIGLQRERRELYHRIDERVRLMFRQGLAEEVERLVEQGVPKDCQAMQAIGYKETVAWLEGHLTQEEAIQAIQKATRKFAKRQLTWYRRMPYIHWYPIADGTEAEALELLWAECKANIAERC